MNATQSTQVVQRVNVKCFQTMKPLARYNTAATGRNLNASLVTSHFRMKINMLLKCQLMVNSHQRLLKLLPERSPKWHPCPERPLCLDKRLPLRLLPDRGKKYKPLDLRPKKTRAIR